MGASAAKRKAGWFPPDQGARPRPRPSNRAPQWRKRLRPASPFQKPEVSFPGFGRRVARQAGKASRMSPAVRLVQTIVDIPGWIQFLNPRYFPPPISGGAPGNWYIRHGPNKYPPPYDGQYGYFQNPTSYQTEPRGPQTGLITGQAGSGDPLDKPLMTNERAFAYFIFNGGSRYAQYMALERQATGADGRTAVEQISDLLSKAGHGRYRFAPAAWPGVDPNWLRNQPGQSSPPLAGEPHVEVGPVSPGLTPSPSAGSSPGASPGVGVGNPFVPVILNPPASEPVPPEWQYSDGPAAAAPSRPHQRVPPRKNERETKILSRSAAIGIALYRALDAASEAGDIIDAIFEALPKDVQKRWKRGRRGLADNAGQYGIGGADWKVQALWHNADKIDVEQALRNIVKNHIEDAVIGAYSKHLPRNSINGIGEHEATVAEILDSIFDQAGF